MKGIDKTLGIGILCVCAGAFVLLYELNKQKKRVNELTGQVTNVKSIVSLYGQQQKEFMEKSAPKSFEHESIQSSAPVKSKRRKREEKPKRLRKKREREIERESEQEHESEPEERTIRLSSVDFSDKEEDPLDTDIALFEDDPDGCIYLIKKGKKDERMCGKKIKHGNYCSSHM